MSKLLARASSPRRMRTGARIRTWWCTWATRTCGPRCSRRCLTQPGRRRRRSLMCPSTRRRSSRTLPSTPWSSTGTGPSQAATTTWARCWCRSRPWRTWARDRSSTAGSGSQTHREARTGSLVISSSSCAASPTSPRRTRRTRTARQPRGEHASRHKSASTRASWIISRAGLRPRQSPGRQTGPRHARPPSPRPGRALRALVARRTTSTRAMQIARRRGGVAAGAGRGRTVLMMIVIIRLPRTTAGSIWQMRVTRMMMTSAFAGTRGAAASRRVEVDVGSRRGGGGGPPGSETRAHRFVLRPGCHAHSGGPRQRGVVTSAVRNPPAVR
mmetsp:Transcript_21151/g.66365  ORF Transcript_21151/g.66365 Transcript_21151/m.66365 type:complete len:328 (+) Transcript_21151:1053-2036(+)